MQRRGFTLIELLVVISILSLLSSVILVSLRSTREKGRIAAGLQGENNILHAIGDQLIGEWNFDEASGTSAYDSTGNGNHGTISGATWVTGMRGSALSFNGSTNRVSMLASRVFDVQRVTISAWVYSDNFIQNGFIFEKGSVNTQYSLFFEGTNIVFRTVSPVGGTHSLYAPSAAAGVLSGTWNHIVGTYDGANKIIYVNGQQSSITPYSQTLITGLNGPQAIGSFGNGAGYPFNGAIDAVRVYGASFTSAQVEQLYAEGKRHVADDIFSLR